MPRTCRARMARIRTNGTNGTYSARLPHAGKGQAVSLRVRATDSGGGAVDQTIIHAYSGA
jgi:hypothetical protein